MIRAEAAMGSGRAKGALMSAFRLGESFDIMAAGKCENRVNTEGKGHEGYV